MAKEQVSSILRALQILECFMDSRTEWTLKALVEQLGLPTTTVFRQVSTLAERGYLEQDPVRKSYRPAPGCCCSPAQFWDSRICAARPGRSWSV